jgi:hypothetical protein
MIEDPQLDRIFSELSSIRAQLRSMAETVAGNNTSIMQNIISLETWRVGHEKIAGELFQTARENKVRLEVLEKAHESIKTAAKIWRFVLSTISIALAAVEAWVHRGGVK